MFYNYVNFGIISLMSCTILKIKAIPDTYFFLKRPISGPIIFGSATLIDKPIGMFVLDLQFEFDWGLSKPSCRTYLSLILNPQPKYMQKFWDFKEFIEEAMCYIFDMNIE